MPKKEKEASAENNGLDLQDGQESRTVIITSDTLSKVTERLNKIAERRAIENKRPETITAAMLKGNKCVISYNIETHTGTDKVKGYQCSAIIHEDLKNAFSRLDVHLARLCFQIESEENPYYDKDDPDSPTHHCPCKVSGFTISGSEETEGVTLHGYRMLTNAKTLDLSSPLQKYNADSYDYQFIHELSELVMEATGEVELYLFEGKHAPEIQGNLFDQGDNKEDEADAE